MDVEDFSSYTLKKHDELYTSPNFGLTVSPELNLQETRGKIAGNSNKRFQRVIQWLNQLPVLPLLRGLGDNPIGYLNQLVGNRW